MHLLSIQTPSAFHSDLCFFTPLSCSEHTMHVFKALFLGIATVSSVAFALQLNGNNTLQSNACALDGKDGETLLAGQCAPLDTSSEKFAQDFAVLQPTPGAIVHQEESPEPQVTPDSVSVAQDVADTNAPALPINQPLPTDSPSYS